MTLWGLYVLVFFLVLGAALLAAAGGVYWVATRLAGSFRRRGQDAPETTVTS